MNQQHLELKLGKRIIFKITKIYDMFLYFIVEFYHMDSLLSCIRDL